MQKHPYASSAPLEDNAPVVIHLGATVDGYVAKMCRTVFLGTPPEQCVEVYQALRKAQDATVTALRPGISCGELFQVAADSVAASGFERHWIIEHIGYGVGIRQSEFYPIIAKESPVVIRENMVVDLLLPSIYIPKIGGPRLTDTILVTADGARYLTEYDREPIFV